jgi:hypothetical protein
MFLNGRLFAALGILIGIAVLNPFFWYSESVGLRQRLILLPSIILAFVFLVGPQIGVQILLNNAGNFLKSYLKWLEKVWLRKPGIGK